MKKNETSEFWTRANEIIFLEKRIEELRIEHWGCVEVASMIGGENCIFKEEEIVERALNYKAQHVGVYFLIKEKKIIYVGQSTMVYNRIKEHKKTKDFDCWWWISCQPKNLNTVETLYIHIFKPALNEVVPELKINFQLQSNEEMEE